jgi:hypothetical protein
LAAEGILDMEGALVEAAEARAEVDIPLAVIDLDQTDVLPPPRV